MYTRLVSSFVRFAEKGGLESVGRNQAEVSLNKICNGTSDKNINLVLYNPSEILSSWLEKCV